MDFNKKYYLISEQDLLNFITDNIKLTILESDGVDNWPGYMEDYSDYKEELIKQYFKTNEENNDYINLSDIAYKILKTDYQSSFFDANLTDDRK